MTSYDDFVLYTDKPKRQDITATWSDAGRALGTLFLVTSVFSALLTMLQYWFLGERLPTYNEVIASTPSGNFFPQLNAVNMSLSNSIVNSILAIALSMIVLVIVYGGLHLIMTRGLGGHGTLQGFIVKANKTTLASYLIYIQLMTLATTIFIFIVTESIGEIGLLEASSNSKSGLIWFMVLVWGILVTRIAKHHYQEIV